MDSNLGPTRTPPPILSPGRPAPLWLHGLLLAITIGSMTFAGSLLAEVLPRVSGFREALSCYRDDPALLLSGIPFALCMIAVLGAHEMGHYLACRRYGIPATLPYFIPGPPPFGTFGAVIRIRGAIPDRKALFDIAAAGPLAGWAVALPMLTVGLLRARPPEPVEGLVFGISGPPLVEAWLLGPLLSAEPPMEVGVLYLAGWFGMLVTSMNLFPVGQLDGGHVGFSLSRRVHRGLTRLTLLALGAWVVAVPMLFGIPSLYTLWFVVLLWMRDRHPPLRVETGSLGIVRLGIAVLLLLVFLASFIPLPVLYVGAV